ncbi:MAG: toprim domain-containing protein [Spirochaetales bacterium]|nr:toprim domain-containing protein [Spirochaetales bacterium]
MPALAPIPQAELDRLKVDCSLVDLARARGIALEPVGKDLRGLCPFHEEDTPSFVITPAKNLYHCFGCDRGGDVFSFLMELDGLDFPEAVRVLQNHDRLAPDALRLEYYLNDASLIEHVLGFYARGLNADAGAQQFLSRRGIYEPAMLEHFRIGSCGRLKLARVLPSSTSQAGAELRDQLVRLGLLYPETRKERFGGYVIFPIFDARGELLQIYGRRKFEANRLPKHLYLPRPQLGIFNRDCLHATELILCESIIDALAFYVNGFRNVTAAFGCNHLPEETIREFVTHGVSKVQIAFDADEAGHKGAARIAERLLAAGIDCYRLHFPKGMDAAEYARKTSPAARSLALVLNAAEWIGKGQTGSNGTAPATAAFSDTPVTEPPKAQLAPPADPSADPAAAPDSQKPTAAAPALPVAERTPLGENVAADLKLLPGEIYEVVFGDRRYRVFGLSKNQSLEVMRVNIRLYLEDGHFSESLDLASNKQKEFFAAQAADTLSLRAEVFKRDLERLFLKLEDIQYDRLHAALATEPAAYEMSAAERTAALDYLQAPDLLERIVADLEDCGLVGEADNAKAAYLASLTRKLDDPLGVIIQSPSSSGKSTLMNRILDFIPDEEKLIFTEISANSLFYMGEDSLAHKTLSIAEEDGAASAGYSLKTLLSDRFLRKASTGKDPVSGRHVTHEYSIKGPVQTFMTTTSPVLVEDLQNRNLILVTNESTHQTARIHALQRKLRTQAGFALKLKKKRLMQLHQNIQRLLRPLVVLNPYADRLTFPVEWHRTRRDNDKYLTLIESIALLHQYQRKTETLTENGETFECVRVTREDIRAANPLALAIFGMSLDDLGPITRKLFEAIVRMVTAMAAERDLEPMDCVFTRRDVRDFTGWSEYQVRVHIERLTDFEYLLAMRGRQGLGFLYRLGVFDPETASGFKGLIDPDSLAAEA